ncbi:uncharacterized protein C4orf54 homolog [Rhincodon typus]|uniref:uncharacterized protein C4orf54 homolog n=1 Tax=Rhincodon typus TaxID=259920 RepID=UPI0020309263|nr:uncharacterized protein C4orf54 homolog [Rhincodon typus]
MFQVEKKEFAEHFTRGQRVSVANTCGDFMSDSSSLVSDLDETDYEVGRLTALAFRSLACPPTSYMELFESGGSTDLSLALSEDSSGTTQWSTPAEQGLRPASGQPGPRAAPPLGSGHFECVEVAVGSQEDSSGGRGEARTVPKREIQLKKRERSELSVFRASEASACPEERKTMSREEEVRASVLHRAEPQEESSKKAKFASCHISNVISKKMQFEQELKMERGAIQDPFSSVPSTPSSAHVKEFELPLPGLTQEGEYLAEEPGRSWEFSAELLGGTRSAVLQESCPDTGPPHPSGFRSWKESCTEDKKAAKPGRAGFPNDSQPEKAAARNSQEERYVEAIPQFTKQASYSKDSQPSVLEDKPSYKQLGNKIDTRNPSRSNIMPQPPKVTPAPPTTQEKQVDPYGTVEQLAPNIGSHSKIIPLDPKYQTLPASFKFETDDCRIVDPQFDRGESTAQRAKGPIHQVRDVRKLVKNTYGALSFHVSEAKPSGFFHPDGSQLPAEPDQTNVPVGSIPTLPMNIQCKSINWKGNREMSYSSSVDKKYWTYAGSTDTSRLYASDIKLLLPSDIKKSKTDTPKKAESENQICKNVGKAEGAEAIHPADSKNIKNKNKIDKSQSSSASSKEATRVSPLRDSCKKDTQEKKNVSLVRKLSTSEDRNLMSEMDKVKKCWSTSVENQCPDSSLLNSHLKVNKVETVGEKTKKASAQFIPKQENTVLSNNVGTKKDDPVKPHSQLKPAGTVTSLKVDLSLTHGRSDSKKEAQDKPENQNKHQKITISKNNIAKTLAEKDEPLNQNKHLKISTSNLTSSNISKGKDASERKVDSRLDQQKTLRKMSSSKNESTQELTRKGELNKEGQFRKLGSKNDNSENVVLKTEEIKGNEERGREGQGKVEWKSKHFGKSTVSSEDILSPIGNDDDVRKGQIGLEKKTVVMSSSLSQTVDNSKIPERSEPRNETNIGWQKEKRFSCNSTLNSEVIKSPPGKYETVKDIQIRLENQSKKLGSSNEEKSLTGKTKANNESQTVLENQKTCQDYCTQTSESIKSSICKTETKTESLTESQKQVKKGRAEQASEKAGMKMLKESQPIKDSYVLSLILEEENRNNLESADAKMRNKQSLSVKHQLLNDTGAQASISSSVNSTDKQTVSSVKPTDHHQTVTSSVKTPTHKLENHSDSKGSSTFTTEIPVSTTKATCQQTHLQTHSSSTEFNVKTLPAVRLSSQDMNKLSSSADETQPTGGAVTQEQASLSLDSLNYLAIPLKEQKAQVPNMGLTAVSPRSATFKANPPSAIPYFQHQRSVEAMDPQRQEKQTVSHQVTQDAQSPGAQLKNPPYSSVNQTQPPFSPGARASNLVETVSEVPQTSQDVDNSPMPCFQYPQTQRKMLVDPETGKYYFVDAPVQPPRKMLLDPETGQYVEVMMPQHPYGGVYQVPFPPYLINPGVMSPSYLPNMPYPGLFVGPPMSSQRPLEMQGQVLSQPSIPQDKTDSQQHKQYVQRSFSADSANMESLYYIPTGMPLYPNPGHPGLQQVPMQAKSCAEIRDSKTTGIWSMQQIYGVSNLLPHGRPSSFMVE